MAPPGTIIGQLTPTVPGSPSALNAASQQMLSQSLANQVNYFLKKSTIISTKYSIFFICNCYSIFKALGQNTLQVQNATMVQPGQLIQTSAGLVQTNPMTSLSQQNNIAQNQLAQQQIMDQQLNQSASNPIQSPQNMLQSQQNTLMQVPGAILSSQVKN